MKPTREDEVRNQVWRMPPAPSTYFNGTDRTAENNKAEAIKYQAQCIQYGLNAVALAICDLADAVRNPSWAPEVDE